MTLLPSRLQLLQNKYEAAENVDAALFAVFFPPYCTLAEAYLFVFEFLFVVECLQSGQFCIVNASAQCYTLHSYIHTALAESKFFLTCFSLLCNAVITSF